MTHSDFAASEAAMRAAPLIKFLDIKGVPRASGIYTAWREDDARCFYVGKASRLRSRLISHYSGQRGSNQFCLYVYDFCIYPTRHPNLKTPDVNTLTGGWIRKNVRFRYIEVPSDELSRHETYLRQLLQPALNPLPPLTSKSHEGA